MRVVVEEHSASLVCRAGPVMCAFPVTHVIETMRPLPVEPVPDDHAYVRGRSIIRGGPVTVLDIARMFGHESAPRRYVTLRAGARTVALAVHAVAGVESIDVTTLRSWPRLFEMALPDVKTVVETRDPDLLAVLDTGRLVPEGACRDATLR